MICFPTINGVSVVQDNKQVLVAINQNGEKKLKSFACKNKVIFWHYPFARGLQFFFCGIWGLLESFLLGLEFLQKKEKRNRWFYVFLAIFLLFSIVFSVAYFGFLPAELGFLIVGREKSEFLRNFCIASIKVCFLVALVLALRFLPYVNEIFRFNTAVEKEILQKSKCCDAPNLLNFIVFVFILDAVVITLFGVKLGAILNFLIYVAVFLLCVSVSYEFLILIEKNRFFSLLKYMTFWLVSAKPSRTHREVVSIALTETNFLKKGRDFMNDENKKSFSVVYTEVKNKLASAGITDKSDAEWIIATALSKSRGEIRLIPYVSEKQYADIMKATERRAKGESVDNIFGFTEFYGLRFDVNKKVLTPRMETELLVEQVLKAEKNFKKCTILDLGTGSGAIAVSVAKNCNASVTAIDVSKSALATAETNAKKNGVKVEFVHSNLFDNLKRKRKFDIIVSNPPYIPTEEIAKLDKNVRECDPSLALDGGEDGLDFYRQIVAQAKNRLNANGQIMFEVGKGRAPSVRKLLRNAGFKEIKTIKDYNKIERIVSGTNV